MKRKIIAAVLFLVIMALLPPITVKCSSSRSDFGQTSENNGSDKNGNNFDSDDLLCKITAEIYQENYCDEALRAIVILLRTDISADKSKFVVNEKSSDSKENANNSDKELYSKINRVINSSKELITLNGKTKFIPYCDSSNGATSKSKDYTYLCSVASPWDCFSEQYDSQAECAGVSLNGLNYLCQNGYSAEEALKWYLPNFEISKL